MSRGIFVTGTDTGVGKTLASCALIHALAARGVRAAPMKPVAAGDAAAGINADTRDLLEAAGWPSERAGEVTPVLLEEAIAPHIAARREGRTIDRRALLAAFQRLRAQAAFVVVEGVGGFRVPLGDDHDSADLARDFALPVVLVVGMRLGCLNHALITADAVAAAGLPLAGWIANEIDPRMAVLEENVAALRERLAAPLLGRFPHGNPPEARKLAARIDVAPLL